MLALISVLVITYLGYWLLRVSKRLPETALTEICWGSAAKEYAPLPKQIWTFWHDSHPPQVVRECIAGWQRLNPDYQITLVTRDSIGQYINNLPTNFTEVHITKQADWLRLALLEKYGGIWLDSSILLTQSLDSWLSRYSSESNNSFIGFYLARHNTDASSPLLENWFLAAKQGDPFIKDWFAAFNHNTFELGTDRYLQQLRQQGKLATYQQGFDTPEYHTMHVMAQELLHAPAAQSKYRLTLIKAEDLAFKLQHYSQWRRRRLFWRLLVGNDPNAPALIKLRGGERRKLEWYLKHKLYARNSLIGQQLTQNQ